MTSKDIELVKEMLRMQESLDQQIYDAYCDKNKINYQRLKEGY